MISQEQLTAKLNLRKELSDTLLTKLGEEAQLASVGIVAETATGKRKALLNFLTKANKVAAYIEGQLCDNPDDITDYTEGKIADGVHEMVSALARVSLAARGASDKEVDEQMAVHDKIIGKLKNLMDRNNSHEEVSASKKQLVDDILNKKIDHSGPSA